MATLEKDLVKSINLGRSFAFIGAGPSIEVGLPSWKQLASDAIRLIKDDPLNKKILEKCNRYFEQENYPIIFSLLSSSVGYETVIRYLREELLKKTPSGQLYSILAKWPFTSYLTTNYDDQLLNALLEKQVPATKKANSKDDMVLLRSDAVNKVFKIHGDLSEPEDLILTKEQYEDFQLSGDRRYWRDKIVSTLHMSDIVIVGYNLSDPEFLFLFEQAKSLSSPDKPIYMFASGFENSDILNHYKDYNIRIIPYDNSDGTHKDLIRTLLRYDPFSPIITRGIK